MIRRLLLILLLLSLFSAAFVVADPSGAGITFNSTETITPLAAASSTTAGGSFTTLVLNATTQTPRWKAYVGNATGSFALRNLDNYTIYDWDGSYTSGEVYASRASSVNWGAIQCASNASVDAEDGALNISASSVDSINNTFNTSTHRTFWVGTEPIANSSCRAIALYVNSTRQTLNENADFQEVLLQDDTQALVYASLIDQNTQGYDNKPYDFQMIVPEDEYAVTPHTYYFWLELS